MPAKEITALRKAGKLNEALEMALAELNEQPDNIWAKRNICWVYYEIAKQNCLPEKFDDFTLPISKIIDLNLPEDENMIFDNVVWQVIKMGFALMKLNIADIVMFDTLFSYSKKLYPIKPSEAYSVLFKLFHKIYKDNTLKYLDFADWWNYKNFRTEDYEKEVLSNGKFVMSIVEQAYIAYSRHLLPRQLPNGEICFDKEKVNLFLPMLDKIIESHPDYQYPPYFKAKLLLALGDKDNVLSSLLPFAKKKRNDFWVWDVLSEAFPDEEEKILACYSKALLCIAKEEMFINVRQKIATIFINRKMWDEAKTEIVKIDEIRNKNEWRIPLQIANWKNQSWFSNAKEKQDNKNVYRQYTPLADEILFDDISEETVIVTFVNSNKKVLNFIASEKKFGFLKYDRFLQTVRIGETLKIRFLKKDASGSYQVATMKKYYDPDFRKRFVIKFQGNVRKRDGQNFGFVDDVYLTPVICDKNKLFNDCLVTGYAIKSFDEKKNQWGWRAYEISNEE